MVDDRRAKRDVDPVGGVGEQIGAQGPQQRLGQGHGDEQGAVDIERGEVALADHRVDDLLNQQRVEQLQQLHKEAGDHHLDQGPFVLLDRWDEPAQAKACLGGVGVALQGQQPQLLALGLGQQRFRFHPALPGHRIADQDLTLARVPQHQRVAVDQGQGREGGAAEQVGAARLQPRGPQGQQIADSGHGLQPQAGFSGAGELIFEDALQHVLAKGQIKVAREHAQAGQWFLDGPLAAVLRKGAVIAHAAIPVLQRFALQLWRVAFVWLDLSELITAGWFDQLAEGGIHLALRRPVGWQRQQPCRHAPQHLHLHRALQQGAGVLPLDIAAAHQPEA